jgi:recombinational DNA repair protein (RecF pathway)
MSRRPRLDATACAVCGKPAEPYGLLRHVFASEDVGIVCTECARTVAPDQWEMAEALERAAAERGWEPDPQ